MANPSFITGEPALVLKKHLVVADLHIGLTRDLWEKGIAVPKQSLIFADSIRKLCDKSGCKKVLILGDLKHKVPGISYQEMREVPEFFDAVSEFAKLTIIKGNHDGGLEGMLPDADIKRSVAINNILLMHGHTKLPEGDYRKIILAHNHAHYKFTDDMGAFYFEPVWVKGKYEERDVIVMPAFNPLCGAIAVNVQDMIGPVCRNLEKKKAFLLDGFSLGALDGV